MNKARNGIALLLAALIPAGAFAQDTASGDRVDRWTGAYAGAKLGYAYGGDDRLGFTDADDGAFIGTLGTLKNKGPLAGAHVGYSFDLGTEGLVVGGELGFAAGSVDDDLRVANSGGDVTFGVSNDYVLSARGILGKPLPNQTLLYATAGLAQGRFDVSAVNNATGESAKTKFNRTGYTLGLGVERQLQGGLSVFGEYEYANFGKEVVEIDGLLTQATPKWNNVSVGVNYRY